MPRVPVTAKRRSVAFRGSAELLKERMALEARGTATSSSGVTPSDATQSCPCIPPGLSLLLLVLPTVQFQDHDITPAPADTSSGS